MSRSLDGMGAACASCSAWYPTIHLASIYPVVVQRHVAADVGQQVRVALLTQHAAQGLAEPTWLGVGLGSGLGLGRTAPRRARLVRVRVRLRV
eukprot:scaffold75960_cov71-Phaeocystis_antarctica.AAC.2